MLTPEKSATHPHFHLLRIQFHRLNTLKFWLAVSPLSPICWHYQVLLCCVSYCA